MQKITITQALKLKNTIFIDARSPSEHQIDHIPNSINIPIFDDQERKEIGTLYKHDQKKALDFGIQLYAKKTPDLVKFLKKLDKTKTIIVYCWRGGIRSKTITLLAESLGYQALQLDGGYKKYRQLIRESFENYQSQFKFIVLWGHTGTAKTKLIQNLNKKIDLEDLAQHRSSLFGAIGLTPRTQKSFETLLFFELQKLSKEKYVFVEGESRKIGQIIIPEKIYKKLIHGINIQVTSSIKSRTNIIVNEYLKIEHLEKIKEIIPLLKTKLGKKQINQLLQLMAEKQYHQVAEILLTQYYDPLYKHTLDKIKYDYSVNSDDLDKCLKELEEIKNKLLHTFKI